MYESRTSSAASFERGEGEGDDHQLDPIVASALLGALHRLTHQKGRENGITNKQQSTLNVPCVSLSVVTTKRRL